MLVIGAGAVIDDDAGTVRTPAAPAVGSGTSAPTVVAAPRTTVAGGPPETVPAELAPPPTATTAPDTAPAAPTTQAPTSAAPATTPTSSRSTFSSAGGSIAVTLVGGTVTLDRDPSATDGWSFRVDDDGPTRVRVRFERQGQRSEIRVEVHGDALVPEIIEE